MAIGDWRVLVTGSRDWKDSQQLAVALLYQVITHLGTVTIVHGDCKTGADAMARAWCEGVEAVRPGRVVQEKYPAQWNSFGKRAGYMRNAQMVDLGADICLAFFQPGAQNAGTKHCVDLARSNGIHVRTYPERYSG